MEGQHGWALAGSRAMRSSKWCAPTARQQTAPAWAGAGGGNSSSFARARQQAAPAWAGAGGAKLQQLCASSSAGSPAWAGADRASSSNLKALRSVVEMLKQDGYQPDMFCVTQILRCHIACKEFSVAMKALNGYLNSGRPARSELFAVLIMEAMNGFSRDGMETAKLLLQEMLKRRLPMINKFHADLLALAAQEPGGDYSVANLLFDLMQKRQVSLPRRVVDSYLRGLLRREVPEDDPRLAQVREFLKRPGGRMRSDRRQLEPAERGASRRQLEA
ncbi:hypothetical protein L7F22_029474 [Adiantum nelumboides]|nr:hypothetical protein [Adiantum nelumboides]